MYLCQHDLSKECEGKRRDCTDCILDKIKAEIKQAAFDDVNGSKYIFVNRVNQIIDKYREESEG